MVSIKQQLSNVDIQDDSDTSEVTHMWPDEDHMSEYDIDLFSL